MEQVHFSAAEAADDAETFRSIVLLGDDDADPPIAESVEETVAPPTD